MDGRVGRPVGKIEINLNNPKKTIQEFSHLCRNPRLQQNAKIIAHALLEVSNAEEHVGTQTDHVELRNDHCQTEDMDIKDIFDILEKLSEEDRSYVVSSVWNEMSSQCKLKILMICYSNLGLEEQSDMLAFQGHSLNKEIYETSKRKSKNASELNFDDLKTSSKSKFYEVCDKRLRSFIDNLTNKNHYENDNITFKSNIFENILKARNNKFSSESGIKEHMIVYLSSGKSRHSSQVFSKQGGKGTRPVLEMILKNSADICKFTPPDKEFLFFSFDNIQTLLKSYRIGGNQQKKALAIVVCSILCLVFMGENDMSSELQFSHENTPANWYTQYKYETSKGVFVDQLSTNSLKECINLAVEEEKVVDDYFEHEINCALNAVDKDMDENLVDSVELRSKEEIRKKRKLCQSGHINDNVKTNRTVCDRNTCKAKLVENKVPKERINNEIKKEDIDRESERAKLYFNIPNVKNPDIPREMAVKALPINPNTPERIAKVLDDILSSANMENKFSVKIVFDGEKVSKEFNTNKDFRKFVVVTSDGLPYKAMIESRMYTLVLFAEKDYDICQISQIILKAHITKNTTRHMEMYYQILVISITL